MLSERNKAEGKKKIEQIIKSATGAAPTLMARGNYGRLMLQRKVAEKIAEAMPTPEKRAIAMEFLLFLRMIFYLINVRFPSQRHMDQLDSIRRKFSIFLVRKLKGFHLNHYLHKALAHGVEIMIHHGSISSDSTSAAESQNKFMKVDIDHHARQNERWELRDTLTHLWLRSSKLMWQFLETPKELRCSLCLDTTHTARNHEKVMEEREEDEILMADIARVSGC